MPCHHDATPIPVPTDFLVFPRTTVEWKQVKGGPLANRAEITTAFTKDCFHRTSFQAGIRLAPV